MKFIFLLLFTIPCFAQTAEELRDMLNGGAFKQYEKMFENIMKDMESLDNDQFNQYNKLFDKSILNQLQLLGGSSNIYKWKETTNDRTLIFSGRLDENASPVIQIKENFFEIKGTFILNKEYNGQTRASKSVVSLKVSLPKDIDSSKVQYKNKKNSFLVIFPKKMASKAPTKPLRVPLKKNKAGVTI